MDTNVFARLENLGSRVLAFRETPINTSADDALVRACKALADSLVALDAAVGQVDKSRPITQQREQVSGPHAAVQIKLAAIQKTIASATAKLAADEFKLLNPPKITDVASTLLDVELRAWFGASNSAEVWGAMGKGQYPQLLAALARFAIGATSKRAAKLFEALARDANPAKVAAFEREAERLTWGRTIVGVVGAILDGAANQIGPSVLVEPEPVAA